MVSIQIEIKIFLSSLYTLIRVFFFSKKNGYTFICEVQVNNISLHRLPEPQSILKEVATYYCKIFYGAIYPAKDYSYSDMKLMIWISFYCGMQVNRPLQLNPLSFSHMVFISVGFHCTLNTVNERDTNLTVSNSDEQKIQWNMF